MLDVVGYESHATNYRRIDSGPHTDGDGSSLIGRRIDAFQIVSLVGADRLGEFYRARDDRSITTSGERPDRRVRGIGRAIEGGA